MCVCVYVCLCACVCVCVCLCLRARVRALVLWVGRSQYAFNPVTQIPYSNVFNLETIYINYIEDN